MITFFDAQNIMQVVIVQRLDVRRVGTQGVFRDNQLAMRVVLA